MQTKIEKMFSIPPALVIMLCLISISALAGAMIFYTEKQHA